MIFAQRAISFLALTVTFLFLPSENWAFWILPEKEAMYGELQFKTPSGSFGIAKNLLQEAVVWESEHVTENWSMRVGGDSLISIGARSKVLPNSYSFVMFDEPTKASPSLRSVGDKAFFAPLQVMLVVSAEQDKWVILVLCLMIVTAWVSFSLYRYLDSSGILDKGTE